MKILDTIPFAFDIPALFARNHIQEGTADAEEFLQLTETASQIGKPKVIVSECFIDEKGPDTITIGDIVFTSSVLRRKLDQVERVFVYIATCGNEVDSIEIPEGDYLLQYRLDSIKEAMLHTTRPYLKEYLSQTYKLDKTAAMHPGSGDAEIWPIQQQKELFSLFGDVESLIGVRLTDSCLMVPAKSVSGLIFATEIDFQSCQLCHRENCPGRHAPFNAELWAEMEHE